MTVMYDAEYVGLVQIADIKKNNDYAMWFEVIKKSPCYRLPICLAYYCKHENSLSSGSKMKLIRHHYILYKDALKKGTVTAVLLTMNNLFWGILKKFLCKKKIRTN